MTNGPSSYQALSRLLFSAKALLKAVLRDLVRLPRFLLDGPKPYLKALKQKDEEIALLKQQLGSSEIQSSERDQCRKELQEYINELQRKNEEIGSLQKRLDASKAQSSENDQYRKELQQSKKEIDALQEKLETSKTKESETSKYLSELQQNRVRELQKSNEEMAALKEKLIESDNQKEEIKQYLQDLKQSREEIASLKEELEISKAEASQGFLGGIGKQLFGSARREASVREDAYKTLQVLLKVIEDLEDAGDALAIAYTEYQTGRRNYAGGAPIGQLVSSVIKFNNIWSKTKEAIQPLLDTQGSMKQLPKESDGSDS